MSIIPALRLCLLLICWLGCRGAQLRPRAYRPIEARYISSTISSNYTFHFLPPVPLIPGMALAINFPRENYQSGLGLQTCQAELAGRLHLCQVFNWTVAIGFNRILSDPQDGIYSLTIVDVTNPSEPGFTGYFTLELLQSSEILAQNDLFGQVAIVSKPLHITSTSIECRCVCHLGEYHSYYMTFTLPTNLKPTHELILFAPSYFLEMDGIKCVSEEWPMLMCTREGEVMKLTGWSPTKDPIHIYFFKIASNQIGYEGPFQLFIFTHNRTAIVALSPAITSSTSILPANISIHRICPNINKQTCPGINFRLHAGSVAQLNIFASVAYAIPKGGVLVGNFTRGFGDIEVKSCRIKSGLGVDMMKNGTFCREKGSVFFVEMGEKVPLGSFIIDLRIRLPLTHSGRLKIYAAKDTTLTDILAESDSYEIALDPARKLSSLQAVWSKQPRVRGKSGLNLSFSPYMDFPVTAASRLIVRIPAVFDLSILTPPIIDKCSTGKYTPIGNYNYSESTGLMEIALPAVLTSIPSDCVTRLEIGNENSGVTFPVLTLHYPLELGLSDGVTYVEGDTVWVYLKPQEFHSLSVLPLSRDPGELTVYTISFEPSVQVPEGNVNREMYGQIILDFMDQDWGKDLGTGLPDLAHMSCRDKGGTLLSLTPKGLTCTLHHATSTSVPYITIDNFHGFREGTTIHFEIGGIGNPSKSGLKPKIELKTAGISRHVEMMLNWDELVLPMLVTLHESMKGMRVAPMLVPSIVHSTTQLRIALMSNSGTSLGAEAVLMIQLPSDFQFLDNSFGCKFSGRAVPCAYFPISRLVTFPLPEQLTPKNEVQLSLRGLYTAKHIGKPGGLSVRLVVNNLVTEAVTLPDYPALHPGEIANVVIVPDTLEAGYLDNIFYFLFRLENPLYDGGRVKVHFPSDFNLTGLKPDCTQTKNNNGGRVDCTVQNNSIEIETFATIEPSNVLFGISHIPNPVTPGQTGCFSVESYSEELLLMDIAKEIPGIYIAATGKKRQMHVTSLSALPSNCNTTADISVSFLPYRDIPADATIRISFPGTEYPELPSNVEYHLQGAALEQGLCDIQGSNATITLKKRYYWTPSAHPISLRILNIPSKTINTVSGPFKLQVLYKNAVISEAENAPSLKCTKEPNKIPILSLSISPKTYSERAKYRFVLRPVSDLTPNCLISVQFTAYVPPNSEIHCTSKAISQNSDGTVTCSHSNRGVVVNVEKTWQAQEHDELIVTIWNIINPRLGESLGTLIAFTQCEAAILDYATFEPTIPFSSILNVVPLENFGTTSTHAGDVSHVVLKFSMTDSAWALQPFSFLIDFPPEFDVTHNTKIVCSVGEEIWPCFVSFGRISMAFDSFQGHDTVTIANVGNPVKAGYYSYPTLSLLLTDCDFIIAKTTENGSTLPPLHYQQCDYSLTLNDNRIHTQNRGTVSTFIPIALSLPAPHDFILTYVSGNLGINAIPQSLLIQEGEMHTEVQISVLQSVLVGQYTLEWSVKDLSTCSVLKMYVKVEDVGDEDFLVNAASSVIEGDLTDNNVVLLPHAPSEDFALKLIKLGDKPNLFRFNPEILQFYPGESLRKFSIYVENDCLESVIEYTFEKIGKNADAYRLPVPVLSANVQPKDQSPAKLLELHVSVTRTTAQLYVHTDKPAILYLIVGWKSIRIPTISEMFQQNLVSNYSEPIHHCSTSNYTQIDTALYEYIVDLKDLRAQTTYTIYIVAVNLRIQTVHSGLWKNNFTTLDYHRSAYALLAFLSQGLRDSEKEAVKDFAVNLLEVNPERVLLFDATSRLPGKVFLRLVLVTDPYNSNSTTPFLLLTRLLEHSHDLHSVLDSFDTTLNIELAEYPYSQPQWRNTGPVVMMGLEGAMFDNMWLDAPGVIYFCFVQFVSEAETRTPTSYQISQGLNADNQPCLYATTVQEPSLILSDFDRELAYSAFVTAGNLIPGLPDLMPDQSIFSVSFKLAVFDMNKSGSEMMKNTLQRLAQMAWATSMLPVWWLLSL